MSGVKRSDFGSEKNLFGLQGVCLVWREYAWSKEIMVGVTENSFRIR